MDLDQVTAFLEVARHKSFSRAAEKLYRTQPAISAQIRALELQCGQKLFDRLGRKIFLTPAGKVLLECGENMVALHRETLQRVREAHGEAGGTLVVGANEATCLYVLPQVCAEFKRKYPQVTISIYRSFSQKILLKMAENQIDLGIVTLPVSQSNLKVIPIFEDELQVVVPGGHRLAKRASVKLDDLLEEQLIFPKGRPYPRAAGKAFPEAAKPFTYLHGAGQRGEHQEICRRGAGNLIDQPLLCRDGNPVWNLKAAPAPGRQAGEASGPGLPH